MNTSLAVEAAVPLGEFTTIKLGGVADAFVRCKTVEDIQAALMYAKERNMPVHVLGGGSNTIFSDKGFRGLVVKIETTGIVFTEDNDVTYVTVAAGENWRDFVDTVIEKGLAGVECLAGIPGLVGGAPMQNIGAYGQDVSETITFVEAIDRKSGGLVRFTNEECEFAYRMSRFKQNPDAYIIASVQFALRNDGVPTVRYEQVVQVVADMYSSKDLGSGAEALRRVADVVISLRKKKSMIVDPNDKHSHSCGSFFTNPIISSEQAEQLREHTQLKMFAEGEDVKVSAAELIELAGFTRGQRFGNIGISPNHVLALVNYGGTTNELMKAASEIQSAVESRTGIQLAMEPVLVA